ncbi:hypothetical protein AAON49_06455 [Pseudotenacibaculum sp. MALMAid0570]|uniref:hypothetical protein n=1 Tax=Pseudotenacibaculum sp. MALMAid0570 TaxID=3143938 RepID=UPI0032DE6ED2
MKTPLINKALIACFIFALSTLFISCDANNDTTPPNVNRSFKASASSIVTQNATTNNPNDLDHIDDLIDDFDCFELVFPLDVTDGTNTTTVNNFDELYNFYENLTANAQPDFIYPIQIELEDGSQQTINSQAELEAAFINCIGNAIQECFTFNFPITVTDGNGNNTVVNNEGELITYFYNIGPNDEPDFVYPISVTKTSDNSVVTINNDEDFDDLYEDCYGIEDCGDFDEFDCFTFQYPITATSAANGSVTINSDEDLDNYFDSLGDNEEPQFNFPLTIVFDDGTEKQINTLEELEDEFYECYDDEIEIEDCFTFNYPLTLVKEDNTTVTVNSDDEFESFIDGLTNDEEFNFQYPFSVTLENGQTQTINNEDEFFELFDSCDN